MGIITDFLLAQPSDATAVLEEAAPAQRWRGFETKSIDPIKLSTLAAILEHGPHDVQSDESDDLGIEELAVGGEEGPWVFLVSEELVSKLAGIPDSELAPLAMHWHQADEFQLDGWSEHEVLDVLGNLHKLAAEAQSSGMSVLLFMSL